MEMLLAGWNKMFSQTYFNRNRIKKAELSGGVLYLCECCVLCLYSYKISTLVRTSYPSFS